MRLNPYYTKTEYYEPSLWEPFTDAGKQGMVKGKTDLKPGMAFDEKLLYSWQCNLFTQANFEYSDRIEAMKLCFLDDPVKQFTDPATYATWISGLKEKD